MVGLSRVRFAPMEGAVEVGWRLARVHWGQGYATEAARGWLEHGFGVMGLEEIVAFTVPANLASQRVMARLGMRRDPGRDFEHPAMPEGHALRPHLVYAHRPRGVGRVIETERLLLRPWLPRGPGALRGDERRSGGDGLSPAADAGGERCGDGELRGAVAGGRVLLRRRWSGGATGNSSAWWDWRAATSTRRSVPASRSAGGCRRRSGDGAMPARRRGPGSTMVSRRWGWRRSWPSPIRTTPGRWR